MIYALFAGVADDAKAAARFTDPTMRNAYDVGTGLGIMLILMF